MCVRKPNLFISKREFGKVLKVPFEQSFSIPIIKSGFRKCGIFPYNPDAISKEKMSPSSMYNLSSCPSSVPSTPPSSGSSAPTSSSPVFSSPNPGPSAPISLSPVVPTQNSSSGVSCCSSVSPTLFTTPDSTSSGYVAQSLSPTNNPLVAAGLVPEELHDIF